MIIAGLFVLLIGACCIGIIALAIMAAAVGFAMSVPFMLGVLSALAAVLVIEGSAIMLYCHVRGARGIEPSKRLKGVGVALVAIGIPCFIAVFFGGLWLIGAVGSMFSSTL